MVLSQDWKHTSWGIETSLRTRDFRCQSCGAKYRVRPRLHTLFFLYASVPAIMTIIGIPFFIAAWRRHTVASRIPIVEGASMPTMRFLPGPPPRACGSCPSFATLHEVKRTTINGISNGTEYRYHCAGCSQEFTVHSVWAIVLGALLALLVAAVMLAFLIWAKTSGWRYGGGGMSAAISLLLLAECFVQVRTRRIHRVLDAGRAQHDMGTTLNARS